MGPDCISSWSLHTFYFHNKITSPILSIQRNRNPLRTEITKLREKSALLIPTEVIIIEHLLQISKYAERFMDISITSNVVWMNCFGSGNAVFTSYLPFDKHVHSHEVFRIDQIMDRCFPQLLPILHIIT